MLQEIQDAIEPTHDLLVAGVRTVELFVDNGEAGGDPVLLDLEEAERNGISVVCGQKFGAFGQQGFALTVELGAFIALAAGELAELLGDQVLCLEALFVGKSEPDPSLFDNRRDSINAHRLACAIGSFLVSPDADEVVVDHAVSVLGVGEHQAAAT